MIGIGAAILPTTTKGGGGGKGAVDTVKISVSSPTGTVSQPEPSTCQVIDGLALVSVKLDAQQGQQNAVKQITTPTGVLKPDQVSGNLNMDAATLAAYTKTQTDAVIAPVAQQASQAKDSANQANITANQAVATANLTKADLLMLAGDVDDIVYNLNNMTGQIISDNISGTLLFDYNNLQIILTENVVPSKLTMFVKSVAGALPDLNGDAKPTPEQLDTYSQETIDSDFDSQQRQITQQGQQLQALILRFDTQTGAITSPDGTVVGAMTWDKVNAKWTLSLRADQGGASTLIESDTLKVELIQGGYKINLGINPDQFNFVQKVLNFIGTTGSQYLFTDGLQASQPDPETKVITVTAQPTLDELALFEESTNNALKDLQVEIDDTNSELETVKLTAETAKTEAETAKLVADEAKDTAENALSEASAAQLAANTAQNTANQAETDAQTGINKAHTAQQTADGASTAAAAALAGLDGVNTKINTTNANMAKISSVVIVDGVEQATTPIDSTTWKLPVPIQTGGSSQIVFDETITIKQTATPIATKYSSANFNYGTNWKADLRYISPLTDFGVFYVTILDTPPLGSYSGGSYGIYSSYSKDAYNDLVSGLGLTQSKIYSALTSSSSLTLNVVGKGQRIGVNTPKSAFASATDMNGVASALQTCLKASSFIPNATCIWNGNSLVLSSGTLDWNLALCEDLGGDCSNTIFSLVPNGINEGANLVPNSFGGLLEVISFAAHDGSGNIAKIAKTYTSSGNKNQFIIEIYENGNYLPERGVYATLSYALSTSSLYGTNQNETYNNRLIGVWDNTKVQKIPSTDIDQVIALTMVNNKKASPYRTLYITAVGSASGTLGDSFMMLIVSLDYGCTNPIGQPIRVSQGGGNGTYEDEYIELRFIWREKASPYKNYIGNAPAFTIINSPLTIKDANTLVQAGKANYVINSTLLAKTPDAPQLLSFTTTGLVNRGITDKIISRLSSQVYNNNFFIIPCSTMALDLDKSVIDNGGDFTVYFRMDVANYTQTFKTKIVIPFASGKNYTNCKFKLVLGQNMLINGLAKTGIIDLTVPATINGGQTLFLEFEITYDNQNFINVNWSQSVLPTLSMAQELGSYAGKSDGQSNFALGMDAPITSFKISPEIGDVQGVQNDYQIINGLEYLVFSLEVGKVYNVIFGGLVAISNYLNTKDTPVYVGLVNIVQFRPDYWETYLTEVKFNTTSLKGKINTKKSILQIDMTQETQPKTFRLFFGTKTPVSRVRGVISDYLSVNFKDNADGV